MRRALESTTRPATSRALLGAGVAVAALGQLGLLAADPRADAPGLGLAALALGAILFALGSLHRPDGDPDDGLPLASVPTPWPVFRGTVPAVSGGVGLVLALVLLARLLRGSDTGGDLLLWAAALVALGVPFARRFAMPRWGVARRVAPDVLAVVALVVVFVALNVHDLGDAYYSAIGDEYAFFVEARGILEDGVERPFSQAGVYGKHPVLGSAYQALVMAVLGGDNAAWRMASVLSVALAVPAVYIVGLSLHGRGVALVAAVLLVASHYLLAYAHTGYNNVHALAPAAWAVALFVLGARRGDPLLLYAAGVVAGLGFYTYFSARAALPIIVLFALTMRPWPRGILGLWPAALGSVLAVGPMLVVSRWDVVSRMLAEAPGGYSSAVSGPAGERIVANLSKNLAAFNHNPDIFHYVSGPLLDPVTAVLAVLGVGLAASRLSDPRYRLPLVWLAVAMVASGVLSPYPGVAISRLSFALPPMALLAGLAASRLWASVPVPRGPTARRWAGAGLVAALAVVVLVLNARQFWVETPSVFPLTPEAVAIGAMRSGACGDEPARVVFVGRQTAPLLRPALASYDPDGAPPRLLDHDDMDADGGLVLGDARCVVFVDPAAPEARAALAWLSDRYDDAEVRSFTDGPGGTVVAVWVAGQ